MRCVLQPQIFIFDLKSQLCRSSFASAARAELDKLALVLVSFVDN